MLDQPYHDSSSYQYADLYNFDDSLVNRRSLAASSKLWYALALPLQMFLIAVLSTGYTHSECANISVRTASLELAFLKAAMPLYSTRI